MTQKVIKGIFRKVMVLTLTVLEVKGQVCQQTGYCSSRLPCNLKHGGAQKVITICDWPLRTIETASTIQDVILSRYSILRRLRSLYMVVFSTFPAKWYMEVDVTRLYHIF